MREEYIEQRRVFQKFGVKQINIHFVCTGNTYRSRLANTYLNSKSIPGITSSSSGIMAKENPDGPINWYALRIIRNEKLVKYLPMLWQQTDEKILKSSDKVIFMTPLHLEYSKKHFNFNSSNYEVWNISDIEDGASKTELEKMKETEETFKEIKLKVDKLINDLASETKS